MLQAEKTFADSKVPHIIWFSPGLCGWLLQAAGKAGLLFNMPMLQCRTCAVHPQLWKGKGREGK